MQCTRECCLFFCFTGQEEAFYFVFTWSRKRNGGPCINLHLKRSTGLGSTYSKQWRISQVTCDCAHAVSRTTRQERRNERQFQVLTLKRAESIVEKTRGGRTLSMFHSCCHGRPHSVVTCDMWKGNTTVDGTTMNVQAGGTFPLVYAQWLPFKTEGKKRHPDHNEEEQALLPPNEVGGESVIWVPGGL